MSEAALTASDARTFLPDDDPEEQAVLIDFVKELRARGREAPGQTAVLIGPDLTRFPLPTPLYEALLQAAEALSQGLAVTVAPQHMTLSTYQAAEILGVSRPTLVKLLEDGEIPYDKVSDRPGAHRRVKLSDVLAYQERRRRVRRRLLRELTQEAVEAGSYGEPAPGE
ncbi:helix-turn-helix domain-containing protein [Thermomonospora cellulosilytica]|uniref:Excisionase family DNA binding protein n=1 Tax=Thermomonospora cellulosilytica TaxID=1411118 RepID=A0A7W3MUL4_9ACTN|nr:helix-turn-helix domain-containing protein [Thermomonospora cellulosilytica]MBA9002196.1 excisionase family DNA binding protein [Thermomonospora cellulosilytica]